MPKISDLLPQRGIQVGSGVATARTDQVSSAVANLGSTVEGIGQKIQEREDRIGYMKARSQFLSAKTQADNAFMDDEDYKTFIPRYSESMNKARDEALKNIRNPMMKAEFEADSQVQLEQGLQRTAQLSWMKEKEYGKASVINILNQNREAFLRAGDEATRAAIIQTDLDSINQARDIGYIPADKAEAMRIQRTEDLATAWVESKDPNMQLQMLREKGGYADYIPTDKRKAMEQKAVAQIAAQQSLVERQRKMQNAQNHIDILNSIEQNGGRLTADSQAWGNLDAGQRNSALAYSKAISNGDLISTDWNRYYDLMRQAQTDPAGFTTHDLGADRMNLANSQFTKLVDLQRSIVEKKSDDNGVYNILSDKQAFDEALTGLIGKKAKYDDSDRTFANGFYRIANDEMQQWLKENPNYKKVPDSERQKIIDRLTQKNYTKVRSLFGIDALYPDIESSMVEKIASDLERAKKPVNAYTIYKTYQNAKAAGAIE